MRNGVGRWILGGAIGAGWACGGASAVDFCQGDECLTLPDLECVVGDTSYPSGSSGIPAADGCNTCACNDGQLACTERACATSCTSSDDCGDGQYCALEAGSCELEPVIKSSDESGVAPAEIVVAAGTCRARPDTCTLEYAPVCGCDGRTHENLCAAASAGVNVNHGGACE